MDSDPAEAACPAPTKDANVSYWKRIIYVVGILVFIPVWLLIVGWRRVRDSPVHLLGLLFGVALLGTNAALADEETVAGYACEKAEANDLERISFYLVVALFSFGSLLGALDKSVVAHVVPLIIATLVAAVVLVMPPIWLSTVNPRPIILMKHVKSVSSIAAASFMLTALIAAAAHTDLRKLVPSQQPGAQTVIASVAAP